MELLISLIIGLTHWWDRPLLTIYSSELVMILHRLKHLKRCWGHWGEHSTCCRIIRIHFEQISSSLVDGEPWVSTFSCWFTPLTVFEMAFLQSIKRIATSFAVLLYASEIVRSNIMIVWKEILASIKSGIIQNSIQWDEGGWSLYGWGSLILIPGGPHSPCFLWLPHWWMCKHSFTCENALRFVLSKEALGR